MGTHGSTPATRQWTAHVWFLATLLVALAGSAILMIVVPPRNYLDDLDVYLTGGAAAWRGHALYAVAGTGGGSFTYPPFAAILFAPLTALPRAAVGPLWTIATILATLAACGGAARRIDRRWLAVLAAAATAFAMPVASDLRLGQVSILLCAAVLADAALIRRGSRYAGALIGLAVGIKVTPALFIVLLLAIGCQRSGNLAATCRRAAAVASGTALATAGIGWLALPADSVRYWTSALWQTSRVGAVGSNHNVSVSGLLTRAGAPHGWILLASATVVAVGLTAATVAARRGDLAVGVYLTGVVTALASPIAWTHHHIWLLVALLAIIGRSRRVLAYTAAVLLVSCVTLPGLFVSSAFGFAALTWTALRRPDPTRPANEPTADAPAPADGPAITGSPVMP